MHLILQALLLIFSPFCMFFYFLASFFPPALCQVIHLLPNDPDSIFSFSRSQSCCFTYHFISSVTYYARVFLVLQAAPAIFYTSLWSFDLNYQLCPCFLHTISPLLEWIGQAWSRSYYHFRPSQNEPWWCLTFYLFTPDIFVYSMSIIVRTCVPQLHNCIVLSQVNISTS